MTSSFYRFVTRSLACALLLPVSSFAGSIFFDFTTPGTPSVTFNPTFPGGQSYACGAYGIFDLCAGQYISEGSNTLTVSLTNEVTGVVSNVSTSDVWTPLTSLALEDPNRPGNVGAQLSINHEGAIRQTGMGAFNYQEGNANSCISFGGCQGTVTGAVQTVFTLRYLGAEGVVLGTDTVSLQGIGAATPEPASFVLMAGAAGAAFFFRRRRA